MQELPVVASDGHRFSLRLFAASPARAVFVICPAMGVGAAYYDRFAEALVQRGMHVATTDLRGQASSSLRVAMVWTGVMPSWSSRIFLR